MIELEMSDSKAAKAAAQKAAKGNPTTISTRVRTLNGERLKAVSYTHLDVYKRQPWRRN